MSDSTSPKQDRGNKILGLRLTELVIEYAVSIPIATKLIDTNDNCVFHNTYWLNYKHRTQKRLNTLTRPKPFAKS